MISPPFFTLIFFMFSSVVFSNEKKQKELIDLINEEENTIKSLGKNIGPKLKHRLFELESEKIKIIKEKENKDFFKAARNVKNKDRYFRKSINKTKDTERQGLSIIRKYPHYRGIGEIYYTLALNERDFNNNKKTKFYLNKSINTSKSYKTRYLAKTALAEYYYNFKSYNKAIEFYEEVTSNIQDEWHTKHLYNLGWCYFKVKKTELAISTLERTYKLGKQKKYIDIEEQIIHSLINFHVSNKSIKRGIDFISKNTLKKGGYFFYFSKKVASKGNYKQTQNLINLSHSSLKMEKDNSILQELYNFQLDFYDKYKKEKLFYKTSVNYLKLSKSLKLVDKEIKNNIILKIKRQAGLFQEKVKKNFYKLQAKKTYAVKRIVSYFNILKSLNPKMISKYSYFQGEAYLAIKDYENALKRYRQALIDKVITPQNEKQYKKVFDSMFFAIEQRKLSPKFKKYFLFFTYKKYLSYWPKNNISKKIYPKIISLNLKYNKAKNAEIYLKRFQLNFPTDILAHKKEIVFLIDYYIKVKDTKNISKWINKTKIRSLGFTNKEIVQTTSILAQILFNRLNDLYQKKMFHKAISGHQELYKEKDYPMTIRLDSALYLATINQELQNFDESRKWIFEFLNKSTTMKIQQKKHQLYQLTNIFLLQGSHANSYLSNKLLLSKTCTLGENLIKKISNDMFAAVMTINKTNYFSFKKTVSRCNLSAKDIAKYDQIYIQYIFDLRDYRQFKILSNNLKHIYPDIFSTMYVKLFWETYPFATSKIYKNDIRSLSSNNSKIFIKEISILESTLEKIKTMSENILLNDKIKFNEKKFNASLSAKLEMLSNMEKKINNLNTANPQIIVRIHKNLSVVYKKFSSSLNNFNPKGLDKEYKKGLKEVLLGLSNQTLKKSKEYDQSVLGLQQNFSFSNLNLKDDKFLFEIERKINPSKYIINMDKEGFK